jgi:hypothetical protein
MLGGGSDTPDEEGDEMPAFVLLAAVLTPGSGSAKMSIEVAQRLSLAGQWTVSLHTDDADHFEGELSHERLFVSNRTGTVVLISTSWIVDEGQSRFTLNAGDGFHGIFKYEGTALMLCFCSVKKSRPKSFCGGNGQHLLILRR